MHGLMSGDWKRSTVSGPQRLQGQRVDSAGPNGHRASPRLYPAASRCSARASLPTPRGEPRFGVDRAPSRGDPPLCVLAGTLQQIGRRRLTMLA